MVLIVSNRHLISLIMFAGSVIALSCSSRQTDDTERNSIELQPPIAHEDLDATLWMQTSGEYLALSEQAYRLAQDRLIVALRDSSWSADIGQQQRLDASRAGEPLPPAVILDVDETVLDNSPYQARLIKNNGSYDVKTWQAWVEQAHAKAVPGAKEFIDFARDAGVTVFFITNRETAVERATRRNLELVGIEQPGSDDNILSKHERDLWTSDKTTRRTYVADRYRVLLLIGDDLNDFVGIGFKPTAEQRRELVEQNRHKWGDKWIVLPNANYGGWERALFEWDDAAPAEKKLRKKHGHLDLAPPAEKKTL